MRTSVTTSCSVVLVVAVASMAGCYLSHERDDAGIARDASTDASIDASSDAGIDAEVPPPLHRCRVRCGEPQLIGTLRGMTGIEALLSVAARGTRVGVLVRQFHPRDANDFPFYALVSVDTAGGVVSSPVSSVDSYSIGASAAGLHVRGDTFVATMLRSDDIGDVPTTAMVAAAAWGIGEGGLAWSEPLLAHLPPMLLPCDCPRLGTGFGLGDWSATALVEGDTLWLAPVELDAPVHGLEPVPLVRWPSAPPRTTPLAGAMLADGTTVLVGGGFATGLDPRAGFIVVAHPGETPTVDPLPGALFDPPPLLAVHDNEVYVFRFVSRTEDASASGFVAQSRDARGTNVDRVEVATTGGLVPVATAAYRGARGAGLVWVEPSGDVRVLPSMEVTARGSAWRDCGYDIEAPPVASLPRGVSTSTNIHGGVPMLAVGSGDGLSEPARGADDIILVIVDSSPEALAGELTILRLPDCGVEMR